MRALIFSLFFFSLSRRAPSKTRETFCERARARAGDLGVVIRVSKSSGGATKKDRPSLATEVSRRSLSPRARAVGFVLSFSLSLFLSHSHNFPTFSLSLSQRDQDADSGVL